MQGVSSAGARGQTQECGAVDCWSTSLTGFCVIRWLGNCCTVSTNSASAGGGTQPSLNLFAPIESFFAGGCPLTGSRGYRIETIISFLDGNNLPGAS